MIRPPGTIVLSARARSSPSNVVGRGLHRRRIGTRALHALPALSVVPAILLALAALALGGCGSAAEPSVLPDLGQAITAEKQAEQAADTGTRSATVANGGAPSPDKPASFISLCANCHDSLDSALEWRTERKLIFNHAAHFAKNIRCSACHKEFPHKPGKIEHVSVETCFECHGTVHGTQGVLAPTACSTCHTSDIAKTTADHSQSTWLMQEGPGLARHARAATERRLYCKMCHEGSFCDDCHKVQMPHPTGWMPAGHGVEAPSKKTACVRCHETTDFCNDCHHADFPKLKSWQTQHKQVVLKEGADPCFTCHTEPESFCSTCHIEQGRKRGIVGG